MIPKGKLAQKKTFLLVDMNTKFHFSLNTFTWGLQENAGGRFIDALLHINLQDVWSLVTQVAVHLPVLLLKGSEVIQGPRPAVILWSGWT